jgi:hypothetical protein
MTNLRHPNLRARDIRKIIRRRDSEIQWEKGFDEGNEWVFVSLENRVCKENLVVWLSSKSIPWSCEVLWIDPSYSTIQKMRWEEVLSNLEHYFCDHSFRLYDIDLKWVLEHNSSVQVARFGRISENTNR